MPQIKKTFEEQLNEFINDSIDHGDKKAIALVCKMAAQAEDAKQILREKGYGWTGLDLIGTVELIPYATDN